jgi:hypothetical protein
LLGRLVRDLGMAGCGGKWGQTSKKVTAGWKAAQEQIDLFVLTPAPGLGSGLPWLSNAYGISAANAPFGRDSRGS